MKLLCKLRGLRVTILPLGFAQRLLLVQVNQQHVFHVKTPLEGDSPFSLEGLSPFPMLLILFRMPASNLGFRFWSFEAMPSSHFPISWRLCLATSCLKQWERSATKRRICL